MKPDEEPAAAAQRREGYRDRFRRRPTSRISVALVVLVVFAGAFAVMSLRGTDEDLAAAGRGEEQVVAATSATPPTTVAPATTEPPAGEVPRASTAATNDRCEERNRTTPPDWEGAPVPQDVYFEGRVIARVRRADRSFYPLICFDSNAPLPLCEVVWDLEDPNGAVPVGYRFMEDVTIGGKFDDPLRRNWAEFAQRVPASCWE